MAAHKLSWPRNEIYRRCTALGQVRNTGACWRWTYSMLNHSKLTFCCFCSSFSCCYIGGAKMPVLDQCVIKAQWHSRAAATETLQVGVKARLLGYCTTMPPEISTALCAIAIRCILRWSTPLWCCCWQTPTQIYPRLISLQVHLYECDYCRPYVQWCCCWWGWLCGRQCEIELALGGREWRHATPTEVW